MKIDEEKIARGRILKEFLAIQHPILVELEDRIKTEQELALSLRGGPASSGYAATYYIPRFQALKEFREWIDDEIEAGAEEIKRKEKISRQSEQDPQTVNQPALTGNGS